MNIRRFVAANSRAALREVKDVLGGDAVIISNRTTPDGVEILAAAPGELARLTESRTADPTIVASAATAAPGIESSTPPSAPVVLAGAPKWLTEAQVVRTRKRIATLLENSGEFDTRELDAQALPIVRAGAASVAAHQTATPRTEEAAVHVSLSSTPQVVTPTTVAANAAISTVLDPSLASDDGIAHEIRSMRGFIEEQLANFSWSETVRRQPGRMKLMQDLIGAGFSPALARHLQHNLPDDFTHAQGREWVTEILQRNLACGAMQDDLTDHGGVFALVGPTGVGKTTTAAKLAARFAVKHGVDQLALITTDSYRIGAQDQLRIYGKILGIPVQTIHDQASLESALKYLSKKKLVLIDTAGLGQRDERVAEQIAMLRGDPVKRLLVLNATVQGETLEEVVAAYANREFNGCVLTKIDEAVRLGVVLDVVIRHRLKVQYISNGQRVPEDLHHPNAGYLVHRALRETPPSKVFGIEPEDQPAWLAAIAHSTRSISAQGSAHV